MRDLAQRFLVHLKPSDRLVLTLHVVEGYSLKEIAAMTGWSPNLVRVRAHRARELRGEQVLDL
ncbi:sigma-70 region 4 domain-containing protein [Candidatus Fermentibacteria bacterium]|nr:sigma-70 region 4 domain-containing protein [Candidatus Fermentibacteria bacterium]